MGKLKTKNMKTIIYLIVILILTSCSIQSRRYRKGLHIESSFTMETSKTDSGRKYSAKNLLLAKNTSNNSFKTTDISTCIASSVKKISIDNNITSIHKIPKSISTIKKLRMEQKSPQQVKKSTTSTTKMHVQTKALLSIVLSILGFGFICLMMFLALPSALSMIPALLNFIGLLLARNVNRDPDASSKDKLLSNITIGIFLLTSILIIVYCIITSLQLFSFSANRSGF